MCIFDIILRVLLMAEEQFLYYFRKPTVARVFESHTYILCELEMKLLVYAYSISILTLDTMETLSALLNHCMQPSIDSHTKSQ